jgi:hypothetical protein
LSNKNIFAQEMILPSEINLIWLKICLFFQRALALKRFTAVNCILWLLTKLLWDYWNGLSILHFKKMEEGNREIYKLLRETKSKSVGYIYR